MTPLPVFHDRDCDLSIVRGKRVAVIGYGSQGRTHALNLRDSGVADIVVGLKVGSATRARALLRVAEPALRPTTTSATTESRRFSAWVRP